MNYLLLSILSSTLIALLFKWIDRKSLNLLVVITVNYIVATSLGISLNIDGFEMEMEYWVLATILVGILLILVFYIMGLSTKYMGVSVTVISAKMSMVVPILFSILYYNESINNVKVSGIVIAILAVGLASYLKKEGNLNKNYFYLPFLLFIGIGILDSILKLSQQNLIPEGKIALFTAMCFAVAALIGILRLIMVKTSFKKEISFSSLFYGATLGIFNFGSIYFLILALEKSNLDSSIVYGVNNVGIISLSVIVALIIFKEKLKWWNWLGLALAILAVIVLI